MSAAIENKPIILPQEGVARVKSVMSGDTVILLGKAVAPHLPPPEVIFTFEGLSAPR
jgi:staphylococcal nuclease domain-containing protein 1